MNDNPIVVGDSLRLAPRRALSPLLTVWTQPRQTAEYLRTRSALPGQVVLAIVSGLSLFLYLSRRGHALDKVEPMIAMAIMVVVGIYMGLARLFIGSFALLPIARFLGGSPTLRSGRIALAWGAVPGILGLAVQLALFAYFGFDYFRGATTLEPEPLVLRAGSVVVELSIAWTTVASTNCLSQLQNLSGARALAAVLSSSFLAAVAAGAGLYAVMAVTS